MKFIFFVEGYTEHIALPQFLKKWLDPRLPSPVGIKTVRFDGWPELVKDAPLKARMYLDGPEKHDIIAVVSLLDLYGPTFYPHALTKKKERYDWAKKHIEKQVNQADFYQFFAVHEVEAWLLSDPNIFSPKVKARFPDKVKHPEEVNFHEPPAKLLERIYPSCIGRSYKKRVNGKELFDKLNPDIAYAQCPSLRELLDKMLGLAEKSIGKRMVNQ